MGSQKRQEREGDGVVRKEQADGEPLREGSLRKQESRREAKEETERKQKIRKRAKGEGPGKVK